MIKVSSNLFTTGLMRLDDATGFLGYEISERRHLVLWNRVILDKIDQEPVTLKANDNILMNIFIT